MATAAYPRPVTVRQGDGSYVTLILHGDEFCRWTTNVWGHTVERDTCGIWRTVPERTAMEMDAVRRFNMDRMLPYGNDTSAPCLTKSGGGAVREVKVLVVPVQFADTVFARDDYRSYLDRKLNVPGFSEGGASGSVKDYFEASFPGFTFTFDVCGAVTLKKSCSYYGRNDESVPSRIQYDVNMPDFVKEVCKQIDRDVDFSEYDQDSDGIIDHIAFVYAGYNEAEGGGPDAIWSHGWDLSTMKLRFDGVSIGLYAAASELSGATGRMDAGIGTFCHELSHTFGLKDLYDVDYGGGGGLCDCLWHTLSLMDYGNFNNGGHTPPYYCAIDRELAGTADVKILEAGETVTLEPISRKGTVYRHDTGKDGEYFLFECRTAEGWDKYIGGHGMLVYHIDKSDRYVSDIQAAVRWTENIINTVSGHECADVVEACPDASSVRQVFFPGQAAVTEFGPVTEPAFESWDGDSQMLSLSGISEGSDGVTFRVKADSSERMLHVMEPSVVPYQKDAALRWKCEKQGAALWGVRWAPSGTQDYSGTEVHTAECTISPLVPGTDYRAEIYHIGRTGNGDTVSVSFSTYGYTSRYPCIRLSGNIYYVGETINLKVFNIQEDVSSVKWYVNDLRVEDDTIVLEQAGEMEIKAVLSYTSDASEETITRLITVEEK